MEPCELVYETLMKMGIDYEIVEHPAAMTTEEADLYIEGKEGVRSKSLFLCNKKATAFYLVIMDDAKRLDMKLLAELTGEKGMRFCSPERLMEKLSLEPGSVSLFGLLNDREREVRVCLDKEMLGEEIITFHPNDNTKTLFLSIADMKKFLGELEYDYSVVDL